MEFSVLGPLRVRHGESPLPLGTPKQQVVLAMLTLNSGEAVPLSDLVDELWDAHPPPSAVAKVRGYAAALRRLFASVEPSTTRVVRSGSGYLLLADPDEVDFRQFQRDAERAHHALDCGDLTTALAAFDRALAKWRGVILDGLLRGPLLYSQCTAAEQSRLQSIDGLAEVHLRLGQPAKAVRLLHPQVQAEPLREKSCALLMRAVYQTEGVAAALKVYEQLRRALEEQLGVEPNAELQDLHRALLNRDPNLVTLPEAATEGVGQTASDEVDRASRFVIAVPRTLPPDVRDFTGRTQSVALLCKELGPPSTGAGPVVVVTGRGGVGKTTLCIHVAHLLRSDYPDGQLYANLRGQAEGGGATPFEVLGRFLRLLGIDGSGVPQTLEERVELYRGLLAERRVLVVLDNAASDDQIAPLLPGEPSCATLVNSRGHVGAAIGAYVHHLDVFEPREAADLLSQLCGADRVAAEPLAVAELAQLCEHLPLAVRIAGGRLAARPHWSVGKLLRQLQDEHERLDQLTYGSLNVRASIAVSYRGLVSDAQVLLRRLGEADLPDVGPLTAAALLDSSLQHAEDTLEHLNDAQLIGVASTATPWSRYRLHNLVRLFAEERARVEEDLSALAAARSRMCGALLSVLHQAHRRVFGGQDIVGDAPRWPVDHATMRLVADDPLRWLDTERHTVLSAIRRAADDAEVNLCWELACAVAMLLQLRGFYDDLFSALEVAREAVQRTDDLRGQAAVLHRIGNAYSDVQEYDKARIHFEQAAALFARVGDRHGEALASTYLGTLDRWSGRHEEALQRYRSALAGLREGEDLGGEALTLRFIGQAHMDRGEHARADDHLTQALAAARASGSERSEAQVLFWWGMLRLRQERYESARSLFTRVIASAEMVQDKYGQAQAIRGLGLCHRGEGDLERAKLMFARALALVRQPRATFIEAAIERDLAELHKTAGLK